MSLIPKALLLVLISMLCLNTHAKGKYEIGAGVGANYAYNPGISFRYHIDHLALHTAIGVESHYSVGFFLKFRDDDVVFQPRIGLHYGTNGDMRRRYHDEDVDFDKYDKAYVGASIFTGFRIAFGESKSHGVEFDVAYKLTDGGFNDEKDQFEEENSVESSCTPADDCIKGMFSGAYNVQFSVGWQMQF